MIEFSSDFKFLGAREYIHGSSLLSEMLKVIDQSGKNVEIIKRIKFSQKSVLNGHILLSNNMAELQELENVNCTMIYMADNELWKAVFIESGSKVHKRENVNYYIHNLESDRNFGGTSSIHSECRNDFIENLIEANKRIHIATLGEIGEKSGFRLGFIQNWLVPPEHMKIETVLHIKNLLYQHVGGNIQTINQLTYNYLGSHYKLNMCFIFSKENK